MVSFVRLNAQYFVNAETCPRQDAKRVWSSAVVACQQCVCMVAVYAGYSKEGLVGVQGTSAGGLLVGALLNRYATHTLAHILLMLPVHWL